MVDIKLDYNSDEILPKAVEFEMDNGILKEKYLIFFLHFLEFNSL